MRREDTLWLTILVGCAAAPEKEAASVGGVVVPLLAVETETTPADSGTDSGDSTPPWPWEDDACAHLVALGASSSWGEVAADFAAQAGLSPALSGGVLGLGSSSMRRWEGGRLALAPYGLHQRAFGGAHVRDVALLADDLLEHDAPDGVVVYAGTNDVAAGATAEDAAADTRCLLQQAYARHGPVPVVLIAVVPTPARWAGWEEALAFNTRLHELAADLPHVSVADVATAFLRTGSPPAASLFVDDGLHLSDAGYALWSEVVVAAVERADVPHHRPRPPVALASGTVVRVDLGPGDALDGLVATTHEGSTWNAWRPIAGGTHIRPGERTGELVDTTGAPTGLDLLITGGFLCNGLRNGGLRGPDPSRLGALAVDAATADFFYVEDEDKPGALVLTGLDPAARYTLRLFGSRDWGSETRTTRYTVVGADVSTVELQTSGYGIGVATSGNDDQLAVFSGVAPDGQGQLHIDVDKAAGAFAYLNLLELTVD